MDQLLHLKKNKGLLDLRWKIIRGLREFFWEQKFQEVEAPTVVQFPGQEPYLSPVSTTIHNEKGEAFFGYLHTSPEYAMKKYLATVYKNIFYLGKVFRDYESFGGLHNPEFTMIEWYRTEANMFDIMNDVEQLLKRLSIEFGKGKFDNVQRISMRQIWKDKIDVDLEQYLTREEMEQLCVDWGYKPEKNEAYEYLFYRIFLNEIEPSLVQKGAIIIYNYPSQMAALAKISKSNPNVAERFELYINGIEVANAFSELTDETEQRKRFIEEQRVRKKLGFPKINLDEEFLLAIKQMPPSAGIALGVDRLVQAMLGEKNIDGILPFGAKQLWKKQ